MIRPSKTGPLKGEETIEIREKMMKCNIINQIIMANIVLRENVIFIPKNKNNAQEEGKRKMKKVPEYKIVKNAWTGSTYRIRLRSKKKGKKGSILGDWKPPTDRKNEGEMEK